MDRQMDSRLSRRLGPPTKWAAKSTGPETGEARPWSSVCLFSGVDFQPAGGRGHCHPGLAAAPSVRSSPCSLSPGFCSPGTGRGTLREGVEVPQLRRPGGDPPSSRVRWEAPWLPCLSPAPVCVPHSLPCVHAAVTRPPGAKKSSRWCLRRGGGSPPDAAQLTLSRHLQASEEHTPGRCGASLRQHLLGFSGPAREPQCTPGAQGEPQA